MTFSVTHTFTGDTTAVGSEVNTNFTDIETELTGFPNNGSLGAGVVDTTQLAADAVTGAKMADDAIDSEHYTDGSIDTAHLADDAVTSAKIADQTLDNIFGSWTNLDSATNTLVKTEVYKAGSDGSISVSANNSAQSGRLRLYTDSSNPPTTMRYQDYSYASGGYVGLSGVPVKKDDYWKLVTNNTATPTIYWLPIGSGSCVKQ